LPEVICNTSPLQYLHQSRQLALLPALAGSVTIPPAVREELAEGRRRGVDLPVPENLDWVTVRAPAAISAERLIRDLGRGETEVLMLALESSDAVAVLDDALARRIAVSLGIRLTGTLGLLIDAKKIGRLAAVAPLLDQLQTLGFRLASHTRTAVLKLAGEEDS